MSTCRIERAMGLSRFSPCYHPPPMWRLLLLAHLVGFALALGGLVGNLLVVERCKRAADARERVGSETTARALLGWVQWPGVALALASGLGLAWRADWEPLEHGYLHFKLLFVFWVVLATRLMGRNVANFAILRGQCGDADSDRLCALKDNHAMIGYVTVLSFVFILVFSIWKPL